MRPLVIRLRNWVGEILLSLPALQALEAEGYELHLVGPAWAAPLFAATGWAFHARPPMRADALAQFRALRQRLAARDADFDQRINTLLFTRSFASAFDARRAGLEALGQRGDWRRLLLARSVPRGDWGHVSDEYFSLAAPLLSRGAVLQAPPAALLPIAAAYSQAAARALAHARVRSGYVVCCPLSGSGDVKGLRRWPHFAAFTQALRDTGRQVVCCPGPGEEASMLARCPGATVIAGLNLAAYAAVMRNAALVVANDTGPGHLAAGVGAHLVSVFGAHSELRWHPLSHSGITLHPGERWPTVAEALRAAEVWRAPLTSLDTNANHSHHRSGSLTGVPHDPPTRSGLAQR